MVVYFDQQIDLFIYLFIYWARIKKDIHDRWCEKEMRDQCNVERVYVLHKL